MQKFAKFLGWAWIVATVNAGAADYLVLVSKNAAQDPAWKEVGTKLAAKHRGNCETWDGSEPELLASLKKSHPRYLAIIGQPESFTAGTVRAINRATRAVDDDPWTDCRWGLITGNTAQDAMRLVETSTPLIIKRALCTTGINLALIDSGLVLSDGGKGGYTRKLHGEQPKDGNWDATTNPGGTVEMFAKAWNEDHPQLLVTSSHATQFNLEMPFGLGLIASHGGQFHALTSQQRDTFARFLGGAMFTGDVAQLGKWIDTTKAPVLQPSQESKVWVAAGNCLIGDARGTRESMVTTALGPYGFKQFLGYVVPTWYGRGGWGTSGLWQASCGGLSLAEAFYLNQQILMDETLTRFPGADKVVFNSDDIEKGMKTDRPFITGLQELQKNGLKMEKDVLGLIHDRDVIAFWGDPLWVARFDPKIKPHPLTATWAKSRDGLKLTLTASANYEGNFPLWLPERLAAPVLKLPPNSQIDAIAADDFLLIRKITMKKGDKLELKLTGARS